MPKETCKFQHRSSGVEERINPILGKNKWEAVAKYSTMRKRRALYFWLNMKSFKKSSERVETYGSITRSKDLIAQRKYYLSERRGYEQDSLFDCLNFCSCSGGNIFLYLDHCLSFAKELQSVPFYHSFLQTVAGLHSQQGSLPEMP
jgi:hypothetical protein